MTESALEQPWLNNGQYRWGEEVWSRDQVPRDHTRCRSQADDDRLGFGERVDHVGTVLPSDA